ncbi:hypothetical protein DQ04_02881060 [Trypanosoma grayi]|uniref:hypothetical protein n=1 Tax=Trypanosoma grayi TaxID=71804 RepID=UPI0004F45FAC|nr:hypothetical protein DQ04_02881060 [Trypanosoma grayi]KEG11187.1 hypothetical protein DQ04_02881060 [Trypanosoma grayi]
MWGVLHHCSHKHHGNSTKHKRTKKSSSRGRNHTVIDIFFTVVFDVAPLCISPSPLSTPFFFAALTSPPLTEASSAGKGNVPGMEELAPSGPAAPLDGTVHLPPERRGNVDSKTAPPLGGDNVHLMILWEHTKKLIRNEASRYL